VTAAYLAEVGLVSALGVGPEATRAALFAPEPSGVAPSTDFAPGPPLAVGAVGAALPDAAGWPLGLRSRNNRLLALALSQVRGALDAELARVGPERVACVLGTSTSGIGEAERAIARLHADGALPPDFHYAQQELGSPAAFVTHATGIRGPAYVVSTACSSSAKALASAARLIRAGIADAVLAGGVDSLCAFTVAGFSALESVSPGRCNPLSKNRRGINIGEAAALFLVRREGPVRLAGWGETSDAHHMSAPDPSGKGARDAIERALARAGVRPADVDYVNLHGTATVQNDAMESRAVAEAVGLSVPVSSTKPLTGHTLGAAGALEAAIATLTLMDNPGGRLPPHWWDGERDEALPPLSVVTPGSGLGRSPRVVLSNSFAFGGNNAALVLVRE
jgi:3-oxoacyl-[acyl-carrier-protein] synthase I